MATDHCNHNCVVLNENNSLFTTWKSDNKNLWFLMFLHSMGNWYHMFICRIGVTTFDWFHLAVLFCKFHALASSSLPRYDAQSDRSGDSWWLQPKGNAIYHQTGGAGGVNPRLSDSAIFNISVQFQWRYLTLCNSLSLPSRVPSLSLSFSSPSPIFNVYHEVWLCTYAWKYPILIWIQKKELGCYKSHIYIFL